MSIIGSKFCTLEGYYCRDRQAVSGVAAYLDVEEFERTRLKIVHVFNRISQHDKIHVIIRGFFAKNRIETSRNLYNRVERCRNV